MSNALEYSTDAIAYLREVVRTGEIAARFAFTGSPDGAGAEATVAIGILATDEVTYDDEFSGVPIVNCSEVVRTHITTELMRVRRIGGVVKVSRPEVEFHYNGQMLLFCPSIEDDHQAAVAGLSDTDKFVNNNCDWRVSTVGFANLRKLSRVLFEASGHSELDKPDAAKTLTDPQIRADFVSVAANIAFDGFMNMPKSLAEADA